MTPAIEIHAGRLALAHIKEHGLRAQDIAVVIGAAGGPKGLILQALDQWLFGEWLPSAPRQRSLIGADIGAWRMAAACHAEPMAAFKRLGDAYCGQRYSGKPSPQQVSDEIQRVLTEFIAGHEVEVLTHDLHRLHILTTKGCGLLKQSRNATVIKIGIAAAMFNNFRSRDKLAAQFGRVIIGDQRDPLFWLKATFDAVDTQLVALSGDNLMQALLASGSMPVLMQAVRSIAGAPLGNYWDGGMIDYHPTLPYPRVAGNKDGGLVLFPHYTEQIIPGRFDKHFPWRYMNAATAAEGKQAHQAWLDNVILISPSPAFLRILPFGRIPNRADFSFYAGNDRLRVQSWKLAMAASHYMRDALATFVERPHVAQIKALN